uniref:Ribosomal protein S17 n=1 Tax=Cyclospora cayetanensis TaxID=88456 RepID=A0A0K0NUM1_9EIME|nr:ribosomal protein S17 [Cyclospora cayetanensis]AKO71984.1 ribosomal protein S17 [Cyclospora cayetanensis]ANJ44334.1 ribosomal protein S17 [Cyclospora cayetanensis]ANN13268.1 ribosomal protein S17 [Cyclospora cayetanensis]ANN13297.1 ribosomal protein S17 [Cyclospora cayetanensis]ANN13326.1 ribosomal protein S17 [Cyclospora cayetanensis]
MNKLGFILKSNTYYAILIIPYHITHIKYKKIQIKLKKYYILNYRQEYNKGDIIFFNLKKNKIYIINKI